MTKTRLHNLGGRKGSVALRNGPRIEDCQLVSAGRATTQTVWLFTNGADVFVPHSDVLDVWEVAAAGRAA